MAVKFTDAKARDDLGLRLLEVARRMQHSFDQGSDCRILVDDGMISDIKAAAACVLTTDLVDTL